MNHPTEEKAPVGAFFLYLQGLEPRARHSDSAIMRSASASGRTASDRSGHLPQQVDNPDGLAAHSRNLVACRTQLLRTVGRLGLR